MAVTEGGPCTGLCLALFFVYLQLRVWTVQARITQWSNYLMFSVALYNSEGNWLRVWTFQARITQRSNYVMFIVALYNSEGNWLRVWTFQARITQWSNYVMFSVALYNSEGNWPQWFPADTIRRESRSLLPYSGERLPVCLSRHRMRQRSFSLILSIPHDIAGRVCQPRWPTREAIIRQDNSLLLYSGERLPIWPATGAMAQGSTHMVTLIHHSAGREMQPQWFPADTIRRESRSLPPYSGERLPVCLSRHRMRQRSFPLILSTPHHIAGRVWKPRWHATEGMIRQNNSLLLYTGERLPDLRTSDGKQESSIALVCRLINHTSGRQRHSLWHGTSGMFQRSSPILLNQICYVSERERATEPFLPKLVCFLKNHATQITSTVANILFG
ncbi:uncharacterized protein LOC144761756 isoform X2 [Lissotriton helveticus]